MKVLVAVICLCFSVPAGALAGKIPPDPGVPDRACTVVEPSGHRTLEVTIPHASDFCPLLARWLASDVLHKPTYAGLGHGHWPDAKLSCHLRQVAVAYHDRQIVVYNSRKACRALRHSGGWEDEPV